MPARTLVIGMVLVAACGGRAAPVTPRAAAVAPGVAVLPPNPEPAPGPDEYREAEPPPDDTGRADCAGLLDEDGNLPPLSSKAIAGYFFTGGFGRDTRFELLADRTLTYVEVDREGPRCFRGEVTADALDGFRTALQTAGACKLPKQTGKPIPDRGPQTFAFRLPHLRCTARIVQASATDLDRTYEVYRAFDALGAPVCGRYCTRATSD